MRRKIFRAGKYPTQKELSTLPFDENGFAWYFQYAGLQPRTDDDLVLCHVVTRAHTSNGMPCVRVAGTVEVKQPSKENPGVNVYITSGQYFSTTVPTSFDAYELIKAHWALNNY